jgi:predicted Zn-ribbon and HTH transcriptional regulator
MVKDVNLHDDELCKWTIIDLDELKTKKVKCNCGYVFNCVGKRILCPKCKKIFEVE